jgi:hypothetical protein
MSENRYACPECLSDSGLWEGVTAGGWKGLPDVRCPRCRLDTGMWRGVEVPGWRTFYTADGARNLADDGLEVDMAFAVLTSEVGCGECGWEGHVGQLNGPVDRTGADQELDRTDLEADGSVGCGDCDWDSVHSQLLVLDRDGRPLPSVSPNQLTLV